MISEQTIDQVKALMNVTEVIQGFVKLKRQGVNYVGLCPFHNEKTGSFTVSPEKQIYKCFGCGKSGDSIEFLIEHERFTYVRAIEWLAKKYNVELTQSGKKKDYVKPLPRLEKLDAKKLSFFENDRKISNNTLLRLKITEANEWMPQFPKEDTCPVICFPYYRKGELVNIKFRGPQKSFKLSKDAELIFFNLDALEGEEEGIIVEGEIDTATLVECGIYNVIGVPNGTPPKGSRMNLQYLDNCWQEISKLKSVIIAVDDDEVGRYLKEELGRRIGKEKCKVVTYPEECKDPNEILVKHGKQGVYDFISMARQWPLEGIMPMDDMFPKIADYFKSGYPPGAAAGFTGFDTLLNFYPGHLTMFTGIPGHGKDEITNELAVDLAINQNWVWAVFNLEEPPEIHATKLMEKFSRKAFAFRKDINHRMSQSDFEKAVYLVEKHFHFVNTSKIDVTMDGIVKMLIDLVLRYGVNGVIINPWNYIEHKLSLGQSETHYVSETLTLLINALSKHGVHCFLIAHPTKVLKDKRTNKYEIPTLYSISGSAHFFNKTHNGISVYRDYESNVTTIYVQKVKWYWLGQIGWSSYLFNTDTRQYNFLDSSVLARQKLPDELPTGNWKPVPEGLINYTEPKTHDETDSEELAF